MHRIIGLLLLAALAACDRITPATESGAAASPEAVMNALVEERIYPFLYARVEDREGRVLFEHAAVNPELMPTAVDGSSWIRIWSMSKVVTIAVALDLMEEGLLALDDPVIKFIPEFADLRVAVAPDGSDLSAIVDREAACPLRTVPMEAPMTVRDLLNHEAGFYYPATGISCLDDPAGRADLAGARDSDELVARLAGLPLIMQPGTRYHYGTGTTVLGIVAERAAGQSLAELVERRVTGPLGIEGLRYGLPAGAELPPRFTAQDGALRVAVPEDLRLFNGSLPDYAPERRLFLGGEGMIGTADGYADFARMLLGRGELNGHRLLDAATIDELIAPHTLIDSEFGHNGYNLWISNGRLHDGSFGPAPLWIGGGYEGTHFWVDPERELVGVIMTQAHGIGEEGWHKDELIRQAIYAALPTP
ncbi:MAG: serine hydrolase domain-containing protein [Pseudomonadota bacterium]